ncbi:MAG: ATP-grasp domain-containing protein [Verrucomicrobia bacterium]|nr:MAG: ATP-grasp domain-containing protein [Verrucomicrobiota bacterium]
MVQANGGKPRIVLIGSAGAGTAFAAVCALRRAWSQSVRVVTMDIHPRHLVTSSLLADDFQQVPLSSSPEFPAALLGILERFAVDTYLPLFPEEIALAARLHADGSIPKAVSVMAPPLAASRACADKWLLGQLLSRHGVPVPRTALASHPFPAEEYFLKPNNGVGSRGAKRAMAADLPALVGDQPTKWIVQEICTGPEVTVDAFRDPAMGFGHVVCRERIEVKSGVSTKSRLFSDEELSRIAQSIGGALSLSGSFCFQVMRNAQGWAVTDVIHVRGLPQPCRP